MNTDPKVEFETLKTLAKEGEPVEVYAVGAAISHQEKRWIRQYNGNDYYHSFSTKFSRPVNVTDIKGMTSVAKQLAVSLGLLSLMNRKGQVRDGISPEVGKDVSEEFFVSDTISEGVIPAGKEGDAILAQIKALRKKVDTNLSNAVAKDAATAKPKANKQKHVTNGPDLEEVV